MYYAVRHPANSKTMALRGKTASRVFDRLPRVFVAGPSGCARSRQAGWLNPMQPQAAHPTEASQRCFASVDRATAGCGESRSPMSYRTMQPRL